MSIIRRYVIYWFFLSRGNTGIWSAQWPDLAGYCWWFCWKHHFFLVMMNTLLQIFADICRWILSPGKKNNKKTHIICIAHSSISDGQIWIFWWSNPNFSLLNSKVVDKPNLIRQCVSGSKRIYGNVGRGGFNMFQPCSASPPRCSFLKLPFGLVLLSQSGLHNFLVENYC